MGKNIFKQNKIINKINYRHGQKTPLGTLQNDECYTPMQDILNELKNYPINIFKNRGGVSPFDWDLFEKYPNIYGIKIFFDKSGNISNSVVLSVKNNKIIELGTKEFKLEFVDSEKTFKINGKLYTLPKCNFLKSILTLAPKWKIKYWIFSGYNPFLKKGIDFRIHNYDNYDWVITNPAFSLIGEFLNLLIEKKKKFIILSDFLSRGNPRVGLHLMNEECFLGYNIMTHIDFENWDIEKQLLLTNRKKVCVDWITSEKFADDERSKFPFKNGFNMKLYKDDYEYLDNIKMKDGSKILYLRSISALPDDYYGWFFCSISILNNITKQNFLWFGTNFNKWHNDHPNLSPFDFSSFTSNKYKNAEIKFKNKSQFAGIVAKRKEEK